MHNDHSDHATPHGSHEQRRNEDARRHAQAVRPRRQQVVRDEEDHQRHHVPVVEVRVQHGVQTALRRLEEDVGHAVVFALRTESLEDVAVASVLAVHVVLFVKTVASVVLSTVRVCASSENIINQENNNSVRMQI